MIRNFSKIALLSSVMLVMPTKAMATTALDFTVNANSGDFIDPIAPPVFDRFYTGNGTINFTSTLTNGVYGLADIADLSFDLHFGIKLGSPANPFVIADFHFTKADLAAFSLTFVGGTPTAASFAFNPVALTPNGSSFTPAPQSFEFDTGGNGVNFFAWPGGVKKLNAVGDLDGEFREVRGAVPEPASWALMIGGLGMVGGALRRRATKVAYAA